jgi:predicted tellurium resistance membrane protein TerC
MGYGISLEVKNDMSELLTTEGIVSLVTLTFLEIVLGIDNVVFISIAAGKLTPDKQQRARVLGITIALVARILLLLGVSWIIGLRTPFLTFGDFELSWRDLILIAGGLFLIAKSVSEIHEKLDGGADKSARVKTLTLRAVVIQIILLDIVFSFDSILTAVGLVENVLIIVIAIVISLAIMLFFSGRISDFIHRNPAMKLLAISFLMMIGLVLVIEGLHIHVPKGYIYFAMAFALAVEVLNMKIRKKTKSVELNEATLSRDDANLIVDDRKPVKRNTLK